MCAQAVNRVCSLVHHRVLTFAISVFRSLENRNSLCAYFLRTAGSQTANLQRVSSVQPCNKTAPQRPVMTPIWPRVVGATKHVCHPPLPLHANHTSLLPHSLGVLLKKDRNWEGHTGAESGQLAWSFPCSELALLGK